MMINLEEMVVEDLEPDGITCLAFIQCYQVRKEIPDMMKWFEYIKEKNDQTALYVLTFHQL
jgi:hypothetical protein